MRIRGMLRKIKVKYMVGIFRLMLCKVICGKHITLHSLLQYFGKDINISSKGIIAFGKKNYFSDRATICAQNGAKITFGNNCYFNENLYLVSYNSVTIGSNTIFGPNVIIVDHDHRFTDKNELICKQGFISRPIVIGSNVWVGGNVTICKGVTIGDRVVIGANSVVTKDLPSGGLYAGNPVEKIKDI